MKINIEMAMRQPDLRPVLHPEDKPLYVLCSDYRNTHNGLTLFAPKGVIVDGQSSPRIVWSRYRPDGVQRRAAFWHDILYRTRGMVDFDKAQGARFYDLDGGEVRGFSQKEADELFYEICVVDGVPEKKACRAYKILRAASKASKIISGLRHWGGPIPSLR